MSCKEKALTIFSVLAHFTSSGDLLLSTGFCQDARVDAYCPLELNSVALVACGWLLPLLL
jgi:hypothetical protein